MSETRRESIGFKLDMTYEQFMSSFGRLLDGRLTAEAQLIGRYVDAPKTSWFPVSNKIRCTAVPSFNGKEHCLLLCDGAEDFRILPQGAGILIIGIEIQVFVGSDEVWVQMYSAVVSEVAWVQNHGDRIRLPDAATESEFDPLLAFAAVQAAEKAFE